MSAEPEEISVWELAAKHVGRRVRVSHADSSTVGVLTGIDLDVETEVFMNGEISSVVVGADLRIGNVTAHVTTGSRITLLT